MLAQLTAIQYQELLLYTAMSAQKREEAHIASEESDIKTFMSRAIARQNKNGSR